jgi:hypothetical protein
MQTINIQCLKVWKHRGNILFTKFEQYVHPHLKTCLLMILHAVLNAFHHVYCNGLTDWFSLLLQMRYTSDFDIVNLLIRMAPENIVK